MIDDKKLSAKEKYLEYLEEVPKHKFACKAVKISEDTGKRWRDEDADFADRCEAKIAAWVRKTLKKTKPEFQLERLLRDDFAQKNVVASDERHPIPILGGTSDPIIAEKYRKFLKKEGIKESWVNG